MYQQATELQKLITSAQHILVLQADNPDADSLASALALEDLLGEMGKQVSMYCAIDTPTYLRYLEGWDRVSRELPKQFDLAILVDASTTTLLAQLDDVVFRSSLVNRPFVVLDHHAVVQNEIPFATVSIVDGDRASTGELIFMLAAQLQWPISVRSAEYIMTSILGDTQGLTNELTSAQTYRIMAELVEIGVERVRLEELRREASKMPETIFRYKADLISRTEFHADGMLATVSIPQQEINQYSPLYNPAPLIQNDILQVSSVLLSIVFKIYDSGRVTAAIRANSAAPVANTIAEHFGGGGHAYASGFKIEDGTAFSQIKKDCIAYTTDLLTNLKKDIK